MLKVLIYACATGVFSSGKITWKLEEDMAFQVLAAFKAEFIQVAWGNVIRRCLNRASNWIKVSKKVLVNIQSDDQLRLNTGWQIGYSSCL